MSGDRRSPGAGVPDASIPTIRGEAACIRRLRATIVRLAPARGTVLIVAESGAGKELVARAVHKSSGVPGQFVAVNCAALPQNLAESILFGHVTGAFTDATAQPGLFRAAQDGTLFLDEVGDLPSTLQPKLLRALEEHAVLPVGSTKSVACTARVVAATNRPMASDVARGAFRGDLYARLRELPIAVPPLRDRREDVLGLFAHAFPGGRPRMTHALAEALLAYDWPFNVREVIAVARELALGGTDAPLDVGPFLERVEEVQGGAPDRASSDSDDRSPIGRAELEELLRAHGGIVARVADAVSRSRRQVYRWISQHGIDVDSFR